MSHRPSPAAHVRVDDVVFLVTTGAPAEVVTVHGSPESPVMAVTRLPVLPGLLEVTVVRYEVLPDPEPDLEAEPEVDLEHDPAEV